MRPILLLFWSVLLGLSCASRQLDHVCATPALDPPTASVAAPSALGTTSQALLAVNPLTYRRYGGTGLGKGALFEAMECAILRIKTATCVENDFTVLATSNMVRWENAYEMPNNASGVISGATWGTQRVRLSDALTEPSFCDVLTHEMIHQLRESYSHPGADGSMSHPVTHTFTAPRSHITAEDITRICAKQTCGCNVPEPQGEPVPR